MHVDRRALRFAVAIAALGALARISATLSLTFLDGPVEPMGLPLVADWLWDAVVHWLATGVSRTIQFVALVVAFSVALPEERDSGPVVVGFTIGAAVYGVGIVAAHLLVVALWQFTPAPGAAYARLAVHQALSFGGFAALGALAGAAVGPALRPAESESADTARR